LNSTKDSPFSGTENPSRSRRQRCLAFIVSYGTVYTGGEDLTYSAEHKELGVFTHDEIPNLHMPEPYKKTIARWRQRTLDRSKS
jgi:hypothetical protein